MSAGSTALPQKIQQLLDKRQSLVDAIAAIDDTLAQVGAALGISSAEAGVAAAPRKTARASRTAKPARAVSGKSVAKPQKRRKGKQFSVSGDQSIIDFVTSHGSPTTSELKEHWQTEGRGGKVDNALSKLVKSKYLKRQPLEEGRGSRYLLA